jgi:hypothetical protein
MRGSLLMLVEAASSSLLSCDEEALKGGKSKEKQF